MTKAELVEEVARAAELNKRDAEVIVEAVFDSIITALHKGDKVELRGFGSFRARERGPHQGWNPRTGEPAAFEGEELIITRNDEPVLKLVPTSKPSIRRKAGTAKGMITIAEDFDEPLEDFREYMQ
jgi:integration host factor subunit beta